MTKPDLFSVPRRFDLFTVLVAASGFALLFAGMRLLNFPSQTMVVFGGLFAVVGIAQALTHGRFSPRYASIAATIIYFIILAATENFLNGRGNDAFDVIGSLFSD